MQHNMPIDVNNNATAEVNVPKPQLRSPILIPLGPSIEHPVFTLSLNPNGARNTFLSSIDVWLLRRPNNAQLIDRLVNCCKSNVELMPVNPEAIPNATLKDNLEWVDEVLSTLAPFEDYDSAPLHLACFRQEMRTNGRFVRMVTLLTYVDEMLSSMLLSHEVTKDVLSLTGRAHATLLSVIGVLTPIRQEILDFLHHTDDPSAVSPQAQQPPGQQVGFGASVTVTGAAAAAASAKKGNLEAEMKVYQETFCRWSVATVQFEHTAIIYYGNEKPAVLEKHASRVRISRNCELIHQSFGSLIRRCSQSEVKTPVTTLQPPPLPNSKSCYLSSGNSKPSISCTEDEEISASEASCTQSITEAEKSRRSEEIARSSGCEEKSSVTITPVNERELMKAPCEDLLECLKFIDRVSLLSANSVDSAMKEACELNTGSSHQSVVKISIVSGVQKSSSVTEKEEDNDEECTTADDRSFQRSSEAVEPEVSRRTTVESCPSSQPVPEKPRSSSLQKPLTLSVMLQNSEGPQYDLKDEDSSKMCKSSLCELSTIGAFRLVDGSPIQIMVTGGKVSKHKGILLGIQKHMLQEKATTQTASKHLKEYLQQADTEGFHIITVSDRETEKECTEGGVSLKTPDQTSVALLDDDDELSSFKFRTSESRTTATFKVNEGAPIQLTQMRESQCERWKSVWEMHRRYIRDEAGSFLNGLKCRPFVFVDDASDCDAVVHLGTLGPAEKVGKFSLTKGASSQVTTICPECYERRKDTWKKHRQLLREEASSFLSQTEIIRRSQQLEQTDVSPSSPPPAPTPPPPPPPTSLRSHDSAPTCFRETTTSIQDGEAITVGPARIHVTSSQTEDGHVVAHIHTEFPLKPLPPDSPRNLQFVFDVALPEDTPGE